jgi:hypothetical protein
VARWCKSFVDHAAAVATDCRLHGVQHLLKRQPLRRMSEALLVKGAFASG